ncbi:tRNA 2-thiouridine(34) synthase MnmA [Candidatus Parcubacteria bacterium]|nr:tRNA 2-thiouridine(34) synthase MnmA [Patescibacteria group bacterium]MCG2693752.1 tRNA 2-thiouridine(34) synthase MnmA [Candidatus Parcubacteria bacterium]
MAEKKKVFVALSGGVDSSVVLYLLKKQGYDVTAVFIKIGESIETPKDSKGLFIDSCWIGERRDAMRVAAYLDVPFLTFDFEKEYQREVLDYFFREYKAGRTPNPDVMCNRKIKFSLFWKKARALGADAMATGHYAINKNGKLYAGKDKDKDQSYFIYNLKSRDLEHILFPIGDLKKTEVRKIAKEAGLPTALKRESQGLCFLGHVNVQEFLKTRIKPKKGDITTADGKKIGKHDGLAYYTIGQRKGIGVKGGGTAYFVVDKDFKKNKLIVAPLKDEKKYYKKELMLEDLSWVNGTAKLPLNCEARIRYRAELEKCEVKKTRKQENKKTISEKDEGVFVKFLKPLRAVTPGQSVVFYDGDRVLGGGVIK